MGPAKLYEKIFINPLPNDKFFDWSKLKALADNKINIHVQLENRNSFWDW